MAKKTRMELHTREIKITRITKMGTLTIRRGRTINDGFIVYNIWNSYSREA